MTKKMRDFQHIYPKSKAERRQISQMHLNRNGESTLMVTLHLCSRFFCFLFITEATFDLPLSIGHWFPFPHPTRSLWLFSFSLSSHHLSSGDPDIAKALPHGLEERVAESVHADGVNSTDAVDLD